MEKISLSKGGQHAKRKLCCALLPAPNAIVNGWDAWSCHGSQIIFVRERPKESETLTRALSSFLWEIKRHIPGSHKLSFIGAFVIAAEIVLH